MKSVKIRALKKFDKEKKRLLKSKKAICKKGFMFTGDFRIENPKKSYYWNVYKTALDELVFKDIARFGSIDQYGKRRLFELGTEFECIGEYKMTMGEYRG